MAFGFVFVFFCSQTGFFSSGFIGTLVLLAKVGGKTHSLSYFRCIRAQYGDEDEREGKSDAFGSILAV